MLNKANKYYAAGMPQQERSMQWIAACHLKGLNVARYTRMCSVHFNGGLCPNKINPVPSIFAFPQHFQQKPLKICTNPEEKRRKQQKETPQMSRNKEVFTSGKTLNQKDIKLELMDHISIEKYSAFEGADTPYCWPVQVDAEVQTDLTASDIEVSLMTSHELLQTKSKSSLLCLITTLIPCNCKYFFNSRTFIR